MQCFDYLSISIISIWKSMSTTSPLPRPHPLCFLALAVEALPWPVQTLVTPIISSQLELFHNISSVSLPLPVTEWTKNVSLSFGFVPFVYSTLHVPFPLLHYSLHSLYFHLHVWVVYNYVSHCVMDEERAIVLHKQMLLDWQTYALILRLIICCGCQQKVYLRSVPLLDVAASSPLTTTLRVSTPLEDIWTHTYIHSCRRQCRNACGIVSAGSSSYLPRSCRE